LNRTTSSAKRDNTPNDGSENREPSRTCQLHGFYVEACPHRSPNPAPHRSTQTRRPGK
jgi:hypothetical protein